MRKHHYLKIQTEHFLDIEKNDKRCEIRLNDRNYAVGDLVYMTEYINGHRTGRYLAPVTIKYIIHGPIYGLAADWCVFNW